MQLCVNTFTQLNTNYAAVGSINRNNVAISRSIRVGMQQIVFQYNLPALSVSSLIIMG